MTHRAFIAILALALAPAWQASAQEVPATIRSQEGCVAYLRTADKPVEQTRGVVLGTCKNGRIDGYALVLLQLRLDRAMVAVRFDNGAHVAELAPVVLRLDGRTSFQVPGARPKSMINLEYPNPDVGIEHWRRYLRGLEDIGWRKVMRVPVRWVFADHYLREFGRSLVPGEAAPGAEAQNAKFDGWPQGWQPAEETSRWIWFDTGLCLMSALASETRPGVRYSWDGGCGQGYINGLGTSRRYTPEGRVDFIAQGQASNGFISVRESYYRGVPNGAIWARIRDAQGKESYDKVEPSQVPEWAQDIMKSQ